MMSIFYLIDVCGEGFRAQILTYNSIAFALPYIIFSIPAGRIVDHFEIRSVLIFNKAFEIAVLAIVCVYAFLRNIYDNFMPYQDIYFINISMALLGVRTCIFTPCRYFMVNHLFSGRLLRKITAGISMSSYGGMLFGVIMASVVYNFFSRNHSFAFGCNLLISIIGLLITIYINVPKIEISEGQRISIGGLISFILTKSKRLTVAIMINAVFMGVSVFYQMNAVNYAVDSLNLSEVYSGYLYFCVGLGMSLGIYISLKLCEYMPKNYFQISSIGGVGSGVCIMFLMFVDRLKLSLALMSLSGLFIGSFVMPAEIFIQGVCPRTYIPLNTGLCNFLGFIFVIIAAIILYTLYKVMMYSAGHLFFGLGLFMILFSIILWFVGEAIVKKIHILSDCKK